MPASIHRVEPLTAPPDAVVAVPGSKSITNRALVCAALADGASTLRRHRPVGRHRGHARRHRPSRCGRTGGPGRGHGARRGDGGRPAARSDRARRPAGGHDGALRHRRWPRSVRAGTGSTAASPSATRPMAPLHDALRRARRGRRARVVLGPPPGRGARPAACGGGAVARPGRRLEPVRVRPAARRPAAHRAGHPARADLAAGLPALPRHHAGRDGRVRGRRRGRGGAIGHASAPAATAGADYPIEPDASAASYFFAAAAITGGRVRRARARADAAAGRRWRSSTCWLGWGPGRAGRRLDRRPRPRRGTGIDVDMADWSDTAPTLAAVAAFADRPTRITGIGFIRRKETDRIGVVVAELRRLRRRRDGGGRRLHHPSRPGRPPRRPRPHLRRPPHGHGASPCSACGSPASRSRTPACVGQDLPGLLVGARRAATAPADLTLPWRCGPMRVIAIDGPAGSGKSTVARALAAPARPRLPRHRGHVPGGHLRRAAPGDRPGRGRRRRHARPRTSSSTWSTPRSPSTASTPPSRSEVRRSPAPSASWPPTRRCAPSCAAASGSGPRSTAAA